MARTLHSLLRAVGIEVPLGLKDPLIKNFASDSRSVKQGSLFFGLPGENFDGSTFCSEAFLLGAAAAVIGQSAAYSIPPDQKNIVLVVPDPVSYWMGELASAFWDYPSLKIDLIGVTGTNGKTTTTHLIEHLTNKVGLPTALFGTLYNRWPSHSENAKHTTAFGDVLHAQLAEAVASKARLGAMEVSSHALAQNRVAGMRFAGAVFTNLTQDHLDYHQTMKAYFAAKKLLFEAPLLQPGNANVVVNIDDEWGLLLAKRLKHFCWRCSLEEKTFETEKPELYMTDLNMSSIGVQGVVHTPFGSGKFNSPLLGRFNLMNLLQAIGVLTQRGLPLESLLSSIHSFPGVPGRMEKVRIGDVPINSDIELPSVLVDYAHTPEGLRNALMASRPFAGRRLVCVFGCGGDRDKGKRPKMGAIASELADLVVLTSDNPRTEDPRRIIDDVLSGMPTNMKTYIEDDREQAILMAIRKASPEDLVLIAGKGHEDYQIFGKEKIYFDDREIAKKALSLKLQR